MYVEQIKAKIKKSTILNYLYVKFQSWFVYLQYKFLIFYYKSKKQKYNLEELLENRGFNKKWKATFDKRKPIVYFVGNDEYQDKSGFVQELEKVCKHVILFYQEDGSYGTYHYGSSQFKINSSKNEFVIMKKLKECEEQGILPDLLMLQAWGWNFTSETLKNIKDSYPSIKIINICMDDRHSYWLFGNKKLGTYGILDQVDLVLSTSSETVNWCLKENTPALFFPLGSSLDFFHPMNTTKKYEVGFVGAKYGIREKIVNAMIENGIKVETYGKGWENGKLPLSDTNKFFNECEIILGVGTISGCKYFYNMKLRDFDALMSGGAYLTHNNMDLKSLFGDAVILCDTVDDFVSNAKFYLKNKEKLKLIREEGFKIVKNEYTYEKSFLRVFKSIGIKK